MKKPAKNNMYEEAKEKSLLAFAAAIDGDIDAEACVVTSLPLPEEAVTALRAACAGIGAPDPVFLQTSSLDRASVFSAVEGLDPLVLVVVDEGAQRCSPRRIASRLFPIRSGSRSGACMLPSLRLRVIWRTSGSSSATGLCSKTQTGLAENPDYLFHDERRAAFIAMNGCENRLSARLTGRGILFFFAANMARAFSTLPRSSPY
ncbi:MAG: hypothetical protein ACLTQI_01950 [Slackia sp.]